MELTRNRWWQVALTRKLLSQMHLMKQQLAASGGRGLDVDTQITDHLMEIHKLEKKIIEDENVRVALLEEREQLRERIAQVLIFFGASEQLKTKCLAALVTACWSRRGEKG